MIRLGLLQRYSWILFQYTRWMQEFLEEMYWISRIFSLCIHSTTASIEKEITYTWLIVSISWSNTKRNCWICTRTLLEKSNIYTVNTKKILWTSFFSSSQFELNSSSYSSTRAVAPVQPTRSHRSPGSTIKTSETIESVRQSKTPVNCPPEPIDVYQQVYHDDSSTHGSRTLDSRFSRDKYDLSDEQDTDEDEDEHMQKTTNGNSAAYMQRNSEPYEAEENHIHPIDQIEKGLSFNRITEFLFIKRRHKKKKERRNRIISLSFSIINNN